MGFVPMSFSPEDYCRPAVLNVHPYSPGKSVADLVSERGAGEVIKLASNENMLGFSPLVMDAINDCRDELMMYPDGDGLLLRQALAARHAVRVECITLGNGSNELLELVGRCFLDAGSNVVYSRHAFAVYELVAHICGADCRVATAYGVGNEMPYGHDLDAIAGLIDADTRVVFVANPNNPTGTWFTSDELEAFLRKVPKETIVVIDEAYAEYVMEADYPSACEWIGRFPNLLVTRTFSKAFGLAGLRVGYAVSSLAVADLLNRVRQPFNVNLFAQKGALAALEDQEHIESSVAMNTKGLRQLQEGCDRLKLSWLPSAANFLCIKIGADAGEVYEKLLGKRIIVRPIGNYGLEDYLRVTVGLPGQNRRFLQVLEETLA